MTVPNFAGEFCHRHYAALAALVLGLAAFNLSFRLDREFVTEWDESLYAISAWEMADHGDWIGVTTYGKLDYYNTKPPLNIWLLELAFKVFGRTIFSLRIASALSAWLTVLALMIWSRRRFSGEVSLVAGTVLATTFGFLHVHSGRTANTDALFTLLVLLVVITTSEEDRRPWLRVWLGPILAAAFMLRGLGVLMPLAIVVAVDAFRRERWRERLAPTGIAIALLLAPTGAWAWARYRLDEWAFLGRMFSYDFVGRSLQALEGHSGGPLFYLNILLKHQYDWVAACIVAAIVCPPLAARLPMWVGSWQTRGGLFVTLAAWAACTLLLPTIMATKVPWYLNTFYPMFALGVAVLLVAAFRRLSATPDLRARLVVLAAFAVIALGTAEAKIWAYSYRYRDLRHSAQGLLLDHGDRLAGRRVFRDRRDNSATFVAGLVGVELRSVSSVSEFLSESKRGDFLLASAHHHRRHKMRVVASNDGNWLLLRR